MICSKILIVEDEALEALLLSHCFSLEGYQICDLAANGIDAIRITQDQQPDLLVMDVGLMGDLDGLQTASKVREFSQAPILFLTGYMADDIRRQIDNLGRVDYLSKPVRPKEILSKIHELLINPQGSLGAVS